MPINTSLVIPCFGLNASTCCWLFPSKRTFNIKEEDINIVPVDDMCFGAWYIKTVIPFKWREEVRDEETRDAT